MFVSRNMYFLTLLVVASLAKTNANVNVSNETSKLIGKWDLGNCVSIISKIYSLFQ